MTMTSLCMTQGNYAKTNQYQFNMLLLQQQQQQPQMQSTPTTRVLGNSNLLNIQNTGAATGPLVAKRKYTYASGPYGEQLPSVARRNARERNRVKQVNNGFANLRQHIPQTVINSLSTGGRGASKKLSKVDTLRIAVEYIRGLMDMLDDTTTKSNSDVASGENSFEFASENEGQYQLQAFHSESSASPTPSFEGSEISNCGASYFQPLKLEDEAPTTLPSMQFKYEPYDNSFNNFVQDEQPDDEELLDYISSWQEQ